MRKGIILIAAAVCLLGAGIVSAESWDLYKDISFTANPNGPWSYGVLAPFDYSNPKLIPDTKTLKLFDKVYNFNASVSKWALNSLTFDIPGLAMHSDVNDQHPTFANPVEYEQIPRGWIALHPGLGGWKDPNASKDCPAIVRWTSPVAGTVYFKGVFGKGADFAVGCFIIVNNSVVKLAIPNTSGNMPFKFNTPVKVGDTIDFVVTQGTDGSGADMTPLSVYIDTAPLPDDEISLSSLDVYNACTAGFGGFVRITPDKNVYGKPLSVGGQVFEKGLGTVAHSIVYVNLNKQVGKFTCFVGIDDDVSKLDPNAAVKFRILGDGRELYDSGIMKRGEAAKFVDLDVSDINQMILVALPRGKPLHGRVAQDNAADWLDAKFEQVKELPQIVLPPMEAPYILTPPAPAKPRINGPKVFGVRPGNPVLFTIPTTGVRPIKFTVENMPEGVSVDEATGIITGSIAKAGEYDVVFVAENKEGKDQRKFSFIVGDTLSLTPYMGWNSWYVYLDLITDEKVRQAADAMVKSGMINYGYSYVNMDDCWAIKPASDEPLLLKDVPVVPVVGQPSMQEYVDSYRLKPRCSYAYIPNPRDCNGMLNSNSNFPDMKKLTDYIHSLGLKAGIYSSPSTLTCAGYIGSFNHEEQDAARFAEWGFDFLKYDSCSYQFVEPTLAEYKKPFIRMGDALKRQKRDILHNICQYVCKDGSCQYTTSRPWEWGGEVGQSWRLELDFGCVSNPQSLYCNVTSVGFGQNGLESFAGPGRWNDPDYLLSSNETSVLKYKISPNEQYTYMSLWSLLATPLIYSGDMTKLDAFMLNILCNNEIIAVNQDALGIQAHRIYNDDDCEVWAKDMEDGSVAVGLFNIGEWDMPVGVSWSDLKIKGKQQVRDLWRQKDLGVFNDKFEMTVPRHGAAMIQLFPQK